MQHQAIVIDEQILRIVWQVIVRDIKRRYLLAHEASHVVRGLESHITDAKGNDAASLAVHDAHLGRVSFEDSLMDVTLVVFGAACSGIICVDWRGATDVISGEVLGALDEC